jgi:hypothetical protein
MRSLLAFPVLLVSIASASGAELKILLPLGRTAYQTNERIEVSVLRSDKAKLPAGDLVLTLQGEDASRLSFTFPVKAGQAVEHFYVNGRLLRPGRYTIEVSCDGDRAVQPIEVYSHVRKSSFRLVNWGRANSKALQLPQGEDNLGFNLFYGGYGQDTEGDFIRAGVDYMNCCTMGGGHQMDLRQECDWSDPLVIRGGTRRVARRAFQDRSRPNVLGVHFYDEPGLTWHKDPRTGQMMPHGIPSQVRSYESAFGQPPPDYLKLDPKDPQQVRRWAQWARWKLGFMDAAWQDSQFGVSAVRPDFLSLTQSQYGWSAFADGYYFTVVRSLRGISGHGGYHDFGPGYFNPSYFLEMARARDLARPDWYLPCWYGNTTPDQFRLEQYLSFQTNLQGMISPPDLDPGDPAKSKAAAGIVQSNHLMGRLGTIFTTMPPTRPPVALLYSLSAIIQEQTLDRSINYAHETRHGRNLMFAYLAGKLIQQPLLAVLDEDIRDGTLAANHKAVILTSLGYLDPEVIAGLEDFAKQGGLVLTTADCKVKIKGAVDLGVTPAYPDQAQVDALLKAKKYQEAGKLMTLRHALAGARKLAETLRQRLDKAGIKPVFVTDQPGLSATRQAAGDVEYLFAVNATHDPQGDPQLGFKAVTAAILLDDDGRPVYDAITGGPVRELAAMRGTFQGKLRFGPGQMRVFARTARPIGGVKVATPIIRRDYTQHDQPTHLEIGAVVVDTKGGVLSGSIPLRIQVLDPLGQMRYDLYRATDRGSIKLSLQLGLNDPAGKYTVKITELLNNSEGAATVVYPAVGTCNIAAGAARRAVHLAQDRGNIFRFFRIHHKVTIVKGKGDYEADAQRLVKILKPWDVEGTVVKAADVAKPRSLSAEEAKTWTGLNPGKAQPGDKNDPSLVGFAIRGPVILLGTPEDNPLIKALADWKFLPYTPKKGEFPGPGRGLVAWQRDGIGAMQESITLIAHDKEGMAEAVGTMYEMLAGMKPLTPWTLAKNSHIVPAAKSQAEPPASVAWTAVLPDEIVAIRAAGDKLSALTHAGVLAEVQPGGKVMKQQILEGAAYEKAAKDWSAPAAAAAVTAAQKWAAPGRLVKLVVAQDGKTAVGYWGGRIEVRNASGHLLAVHHLPQDVTALVWSATYLIAGDADGRLTALASK